MRSEVEGWGGGEEVNKMSGFHTEGGGGGGREIGIPPPPKNLKRSLLLACNS